LVVKSWHRSRDDEAAAHEQENRGGETHGGVEPIDGEFLWESIDFKILSIENQTSWQKKQKRSEVDPVDIRKEDLLLMMEGNQRGS
jgi:hypothetical protein